MLSLMINSFFLIRSAWRCLSAPPGGHGHPPGRGPPRLGHVAVPPLEPPPLAPAPGRGAQQTTPSFLPKTAAAPRHCAHEPGDALEQVPQDPVLLSQHSEMFVCPADEGGVWGGVVVFVGVLLLLLLMIISFSCGAGALPSAGRRGCRGTARRRGTDRGRG